MGNQVCCQQTRTQGTFEKQDPEIIKRSIILEHPPKVQEKVGHVPHQTTQQPNHEKAPQQKPAPVESIPIPEVTYKVQEVLDNKKFFSNELADLKNVHVKRYGTDVYVGKLDEYELRPNGFGKMYKPDRSLYVGHFNNGKAQGKGAYIFSDGSYYYGDFNNNCADSLNGEFISQTMQYRGGFKNNKFDGQGIEEGKGYIYEGEFHNGTRTKGTLKWDNNSHIYTGTFNKNNQFHGRGNLKEPQGTYQGDFVNGEKQGNGIYHYPKGSRYEGTYKAGVREGHGTIYHGTGEIAYKGEMKAGLPHGKGYMIKDGKQVEANWVLGIDANLMPK